MENNTTSGTFTLGSYIILYDTCAEHNWVRVQLKSTHHPGLALSYECDTYTAFLDRNTSIEGSLKQDVLQLLDHFEAIASQKPEERPYTGVVLTKTNP